VRVAAVGDQEDQELVQTVMVNDDFITAVLKGWGKEHHPDAIVTVERVEQMGGLVVAAVNYHNSASGDHGHRHYTVIEDVVMQLVDADTLLEYAVLKVDSAALGLVLWELKCKDGECGWRGYN